VGGRLLAAAVVEDRPTVKNRVRLAMGDVQLRTDKLTSPIR